MEARKKLGQLKKGLVVCKASLLFNWRDEIQKHSHCTAKIVSGDKKKRSKIYSDFTFSDDTFLVISYNTFRKDIEHLQLLDNMTSLDFMVVDEAHAVKNPESQLGSAIHRIPARFKYILTATPLPNSPLEAYNYLKFGGLVDMNWWAFRQRYAIFGGYAGKEVIGYKNITELRRLIQLNMLRRRKQEKLKELPEVTFKEIRLKMTPQQASLYKAVAEQIIEELNEMKIPNADMALTKFLRLQQVTDSIELLGVNAEASKVSAKLNALDELLEDLIENNNEKVIIFSRFKAMTDIIQKRYEKYNPAIIHGEVNADGATDLVAIRRLTNKYGKAWSQFSTEKRQILIEEEKTSERQKQVYKFQGDVSCKLFIGCAPACREGLTLTAATHVIFIDTEWSYAYVEQAYSRAHRIGQKNAVTVYYLLCEGTIDEHVLETVKTKQDMAKLLIDTSYDNLSEINTAKQLISKFLGGN